MRLGIVFLTCLLAAKPVIACSPVEERILSSLDDTVHASLNAEGAASYVDFDTVSPICKSWPQKDGYAIVAKPYVYTMKNDGLNYLGMFIVVLNEANGATVATVNEKKVMVVDALVPTGVNIDTANYKIKDGMIAFGVRTERRNNSDAVPRQDEFANLYILDQNKIRKIANSLAVESYQGEGVRDCEFVTRKKNTLISVLGSSTNGYFDLLARVKSIHAKLVKNGSSCKEVSEPVKTVDYILKFNGVSYELPEALQAAVN